jgi:hypothetical protein
MKKKKDYVIIYTLGLQKDLLSIIKMKCFFQVHLNFKH